MMKIFAIWGVLGLLLGVGVGYAASRTSFMVGGEYFVPNNSEKPAIHLSSSRPSSEKGRPRVEVLNGEKHRFGVMHRGTKQSHLFLFKNTGTAPLTLELGKTTCKCTLSELANNEILPGETAEVRLEWEGKASSTEFSQSAEIRTNDPERSMVRLFIEGTLEDAVRAMPERVAVPNISSDEETRRTVRLFATDTEVPLVVEKFEFRREDLAKYFHLDWRPLDADELREGQRASSGVELTISVRPGMPTGTLDQVLHLHLNTPDLPEIDIPISGNVISDISVVGRGTPFNSERNLLALGAIPRDVGTKKELIILVKGNRREEITLEIDRLDPENVLRATLGEPTTSERIVRYPLTVEIVPGQPPVNRLGNEQAKVGRIYLKTTNSTSDELVINVSFVTN